MFHTVDIKWCGITHTYLYYELFRLPYTRYFTLVLFTLVRNLLSIPWKKYMDLQSSQSLYLKTLPWSQTPLELVNTKTIQSSYPRVPSSHIWRRLTSRFIYYFRAQFPSVVLETIKRYLRPGFSFPSASHSRLLWRMGSSVPSCWLGFGWVGFNQLDRLSFSLRTYISNYIMSDNHST